MRPAPVIAELTARLTPLAFRAGWRAVRLLPEGTAYRLFEQLADLTHRRGGRSVDRLYRNYALVRPDLDAAELDALVRQGLRSYLRYWCDAFRLPDLAPEDLDRRVRTEGAEGPRADLAGGQGVIFFLGHLGNWDLAGAWATHHFAPVTTVAERLQPEDLYRRFLAYRERLGMTILPLGGGSVFRALVRTVRGGGCVPLLADRDLTDTGVEVDFCGHRARMAAGPAGLALATGAPLRPVAVHYEDVADRGPGDPPHRIIVRFGPVATTAGATRDEQVRDLTQQCADFLAQAIRERTADWHMLQRVFVTEGQAVR